MGSILGQIFCTFHKDGCILGRNFLYILVKWVHFSGKNVCTLGRKFVPKPSITSKIHREPSPGLFCTVLNNRLLSFIEKQDLGNKFQIGFTKECRTSDHIFTLKTLIDKYTQAKQKLYTCFIDFCKEFDTI